MAGSDKLYLQPVLADLLAGLQTTMSSIDGIVDGLGDAVTEMKNAIDGVSTTVNQVKSTLTATNNKLEKVNSSVGETAELGIFPAEITGKTAVETISVAAWTDEVHRYEATDNDKTAIKVESFADGAFNLAVVMNGTGNSIANPGIAWIDLTTNIETVICEQANNSGSTDPQTFSLSVTKGHSYQLAARWGSNASADNDLIIRSLSYAGYVYKLGAVSANVINVEIPA